MSGSEWRTPGPVWTLATSVMMAPSGPANCQCRDSTLANFTNVPGPAIVSCSTLTFADPDDVAQPPADQPALALRGVGAAGDVPVFGQHLVWQQEDVEHHVAVFFVVDEEIGGQADFREVALAIVGDPELLAEPGKDRIAVALAQRQDGVFALLDVELAVGVKGGVVEPERRPGSLGGLPRRLGAKRRRADRGQSGGGAGRPENGAPQKMVTLRHGGSTS
jgi:hypothetical protein